MGAPELQFVDDFSQADVGSLPPSWQSVTPDTAWAIAELDRPRQNQEFWPAVSSPTMHVAFPVMDRDPNTGRLYVVYRQGYTHAPDLAPRDGAIMMVTSDDDGQTWSRPQCLFKDPDRDDRNAAIGVGRDGTVVVCWDQYLHRWHQRVLAMISTDSGETWSAPMRLGNTENLVCRGRPIELSDGQWLFPLYCHYGVEEIGDYAVLVDLESGEQEQCMIPNEPTELGAGDEMSVCEVEPGRVLALLRSEYMPWLVESWSEDGGRTWSERRLTEIPSQFAPCDIIKLPDGRLACSFSFRERRNERLVLSDDGGRTWDVENSLDIFDATVGIGDRSYVSSAVLSDGSVGSVLYETEPYPHGGKIWFARTDLGVSGKTSTKCLRNAGGRAADAVSVALDGSDCTVCVRYRFTGRFELDTQGGLEVKLADDKGELGFGFWMGTPRDRSKPHEPTNRWTLSLKAGAQTDAAGGVAKGDSFNDGNEHTLRLEYRSGKVSAAIDDHTQVEEVWPGLKPRRLELVAHSASVAVYRVEVWR